MQTFVWQIDTMQSMLGTGLYDATSTDQVHSKIRFLALEAEDTRAGRHEKPHPHVRKGAV